MAVPHGRALLLGGSAVYDVWSFLLFSAVLLRFGAFLEAPKSYERNSWTVAKLSLIRTQWSLFRKILRSFDPPNTSKRQIGRASCRERVYCREYPASGVDHGGSAMGGPTSCDCRARPWPSPMAELSCWGARRYMMFGRFCCSALFFCVLGLFSKHRSRMNVILGLLRSSLRYGRNGPCFVRF